MATATIVLKDEVNTKITGLDLDTRKKLANQFSFILPYAYHTPAFKLGRWDGKVSFFNIGGSTYSNLLEEILPVLINDGYEVVVDDQRTSYGIKLNQITEDHFSYKTWPVGHPMEGEPVVLRDYQCNVINQFTTDLQGLQIVPTGAGKTLITAALSNLIETSMTTDEHIEHKLKTGQNARSIVIVPNKDLVIQTEEDYVNLGLDVGVYFGDRKDIGKTHTICTWQSLHSMDKRFKDGLSELSVQEFAQGVICLIVDEVHSAKADALQKLLGGPFAHVPIRWGLTGTLPKDKIDQLRLQISLGPVLNKMAAKELQDLGVLAGCHVNIEQLQDTAVYSNYQQELTFLTTDERRLDHMSARIKEISASGNTLVLVDRIKAGEGIIERLSDADAVFISGAMKSTKRKGEYKEISTSDNKIIVATYGVAAVGLNIPRIFNLILIEPGKSFVRVIQSIGRGLRKAKDKDHVDIYDFTSTCKFSKRHLRERKKFYTESDYPFTIKKTDYKK